MKSAIGLFTLAAILFLLFLPSYTRMQDLKEKNSNYQRDIQRLKIINAQLREEKNKLEKDPFYLEKVGRERMGLVRKGETVYRIEPVEVTPTKLSSKSTSKGTIKGYKQ